MIVYRYLFGEKLFDELEGFEKCPGRTSPGMGPRYIGTLKRTGQTVVTAESPTAWRVMPGGELPDDYEQDAQDRLWALHDAIAGDLGVVQAGGTLPPERTVLLLRRLAGVNINATLVRAGLEGNLWTETSGAWREEFDKVYVKPQEEPAPVGADAFNSVMSRLRSKG